MLRVVAVVALVLGLWALIAWQRSLAVRDAHLERGQAYAARTVERLGVLPDVLGESSGVAVSRTQPGVLWSHNDSGDGPTLYAIDRSGRLLATMPIANAAARDWEDIAAGPCPASRRPSSARGDGPPADPPAPAPASEACLYVADTGDNERVRDMLTIYVFAEPRLTASGVASPAVVAQAIRYRYPDAPHDCEAVAVLPDGEVTLVTKGRTGTIEFFGLAGSDVARALASGETLVAERLGDTGIRPDPRIGRQATGAALSPSGTVLAVRTYTEIYFYQRADRADGGRRWRDLMRPCFVGDAEPVGEAIDFLDEDALVLTSERGRNRPGPIHRVQC